VSRAGADGVFKAIGDVTGASFADSGLTPQTTYRWRVSAILSGGEGPASDDVIGTTLAPPPRCDHPGSCPLAR
jgi:hypothetical protein